MNEILKHATLPSQSVLILKGIKAWSRYFRVRYQPLCSDHITDRTLFAMAASKSRTRRSKVVPNWSCDRRPSSSKGKDWRPSHFFKIILPSTLADKKLVMHPRQLFYASTLFYMKCLTFFLVTKEIRKWMQKSIFTTLHCNGLLVSIFTLALRTENKRVLHCCFWFPDSFLSIRNGFER